MYYESIIHEEVKVADAKAAAEHIRSDERAPYKAVTWTNEKGQFYVCSDGHIDNPFIEVAFIKKVQVPDDTALFLKTESFTNGWIDTTEKLHKYFEEAEAHTEGHATQLLLGKEDARFASAMFICGCCGEQFRGMVLEQLEHDQDNNHGYCPSCVEEYHL